MTDDHSMAIVTGGGRGIGRASALTLAGRGLAVAVVARTAQDVQDTAAEIVAAGGRAAAISGDVSDWDSCPALVAAAEDQLHSDCAVLVNAAGVTGPIDELTEIPRADWQTVLDVNLAGAFAMCRAVLPAMRTHGSGRIVNVISGLARRAQPGLGPYSVSKAALLHLSRILDAENRERGVRVFAVEPGVVRTDMNTFLRSQDPTGVRASVIDMLDRMASDPGVVEPEESAALIALVAGGQADDLAGESASIYDPTVRERLG